MGRRSKKAKSFKLQPAFRQTEKEEVHRSEPEDDESDEENKTAEKIRKIFDFSTTSQRRTKTEMS